MEDLSSTIGPLIEKATDPHNPLTNTTAVVEFCNVLNKEPNCANLASRVLALKLQSPYEWEALQALNLLDTCMKCCGPAFHAEVGKFRFLNEMIKLVSPKYLGNRTHPQVKSKVIELMHSWTNDYPKETKINEAYEMLKKQGVVKEENHRENLTNSTQPPSTPKTKSSIFQDDERSRLLQKLLQSKNPDDLQAANRLIKTMVKEDERKAEMNSRRMIELESVHNNTRLLNEMLDNYKPGQASPEDLELIKELHQTCEGLRPKIVRLASETQDNEAMLNEVLSANDELGQVFEKYTLVIIHGRSLPDGGKLNENLTSLLDLSTPSEEKLPPVEPALLGNQLQGLEINNEKSDSTASSTVQTPKTNSSNLEILGDIFAVSPLNNEKTEVKNILQPVTISHVSKSAPQADEDPKKTSKVKALEDLDVLGETLLKQNLPSHLKTGNSFPRTTQKIPMNQLSKITQEESLSAIHSEMNSKLNIDFLIGSAVSDVTPSTSALTMDLLNGDDSMVDLNEDFEESPKSDTIEITNSQIETNPVNIKENEIVSTKSSLKKIDVKPLNDINITLESIKPSSIPPLTVLDDKNGISVILHFAENSPRPDVSVVVITTISKNPSPLKTYLFQAVVPKTCKLRLQSSSGTSLPGYTPFLPPSAITQIMLIANPNKEEISLKFMISYSLEEETITEMGEVEKLPLII